MHEISELRFQILQTNGCQSFQQSIVKYNSNIMFLGYNKIWTCSLFSWKEYIEYLKSSGQDWLTVLKVALEIYNGDLKGYAKVPDEKEIREYVLKGYLKDLLKSSIETVIIQFKLKDGRGENEQLHGKQDKIQADSIAIKVAIEFCLNINSTDFLFNDIVDLFH